MADLTDPNMNEDDHLDPNDPSRGDVPIEEDELTDDSPRRAASAQFVVESEVGSRAALREAMDPANQSLADALRLSFRVLQLVILVLVVLFFASGFKTVDEGQSGVLTRFGEIVTVRGQSILEPGPQFSVWPYPIGDFIVFDVENRSISLGNAFWPHIPAGRTEEQAIEAAGVQQPLHPAQDGYVLTRDGDIAHLRVTATYEIEPEGLLDFVHSVRQNDAHRLVELALRRAVIHSSARSGLGALVDRGEELTFEIQHAAQNVLDDMNSGIRIVSVTLPDTKPAFAIQRTFRDLQNARVEAEQMITRARRDAEQMLIDAAGEQYRDVIRLINRYERALNTGDEARAEEVLVELNERYDVGELSGEVARVIQFARAYRSQIESSLGNESRRFASLMPAFREHPDLVVRQRWLDAYSYVLSRNDAELWYVPQGLGQLRFALSGLEEIRERRQKQRMDRREREAREMAFDLGGPYLRRARDIQLEGPGRQLRIDEEGRIRGLGRRGRE